MELTREITLRRPFDAHVHLRDGSALPTVVPHVARDFGRALVMPNLTPPVTTTEAALAYRERILEHVPDGVDFEPLMALYLTDTTTPEEIARAATTAGVVAVKLYPAGATTNSDAGVTSMDRVADALAAMEEHGLLLLVHGEVTHDEVDVFDREARYLDEVLAPVVEAHPHLRVVLEHVTTRDGVDFVRSARDGVAATITAHHLLYHRNHMLAGRIRPHLYCLPILKASPHRAALIEAATGDDPRFFLGTDSAPHGRSAKECAHGCAGCYTSPLALALYAEVFEEAGALDRLDAFAHTRGTAFYGLPEQPGTVTLRREEWAAPSSYPFGDEDVVPLRAGETLRWRVV
jgi:dihydroorotase